MSLYGPFTAGSSQSTRYVTVADATQTPPTTVSAVDAENATATQGTAVAVLNTVIDRQGVFFDRFTGLLENQYSVE